MHKIKNRQQKLPARGRDVRLNKDFRGFTVNIFKEPQEATLTAVKGDMKTVPTDPQNPKGNYRKNLME